MIYFSSSGDLDVFLVKHIQTLAEGSMDTSNTSETVLDIDCQNVFITSAFKASYPLNVSETLYIIAILYVLPLCS